jgi:multicomponent Na+:H+ antiporter subunit D
METVAAIPWEGWVIVVPLLAALVALLPVRRVPLFILTVGVMAAVLAGLVLRIWQTGPLRHRLGGWGAPLGIELQADGLSVILLLVSALLLGGAGLYALADDDQRPAMHARQGLFWSLWLLLWGSMNALLLSADLFNIYICLELLSLAAVALAAQGGGQALLSSMRYLLVTLLGSLAFLLGVALLYGTFGALDLSLLRGGSSSAALVVPLALMTVGLLLKSALFPLHFWLPPAHAKALPAVSALLSGLIVKGSVYLLLRLWMQVFSEPLAIGSGQLLGGLGAAAILWGSFLALRQQRLKYLLAYSTVAQLGYLFLYFPLTANSAGWGALAQAGMLYHLLAHACAKGGMFLAAGCMVRATGSDRLRDLVGLAPHLRQPLLAFAIGGVTLMGLPPSGGFAAKWLLLDAALRSGQWWWLPVIIAGGLLAAVYVFRVLRPTLVFVQVDDVFRPVPRGMQRMSLLLALFSLLLGLGGSWPMRLAEIGAPFVTAFAQLPALDQQNGALLLITLGSSLLTGIIIFYLGEHQQRLRTLLNLAGAGIKLAAVAAMLWGVFHGQAYELRWGLFYTLELVLRADALALLFISLSAVLWLLTTVYAVGYLEGSPNRSRFFGFFSLCVTATVGIALAGNLITFFVFYELLTLSTYPLVVHRGTSNSIYAGDTYLQYTLVGGAVLLLGIIWLQSLAGPVEFLPGGALAHLTELPYRWQLLAIFALLIGALGVKAALVPLHGWLPIAMVAPAPVSALLHAVAVVKAGAFGIVRVVYDVFGTELAAALGGLAPLAAVAGFTIIYGSLRALAQDDLKRRLAYSTVSQLSYIVLGVATLGPLATIGGLVHLVHQGLMKITLFFCAGNVAETLGVHKVCEMDGLGRRMPWTMTAFTVAAFGMIGVPPLAGFVSKWYLGLGALAAGHYWVVAVLAVSSLLNAAYFLPIVHAAWFKAPSERWPPRTTPFETSRRLLLPAVATAVLALAAGLLAGLSFSPLGWVTFIAGQTYQLRP